MTLRVLAQVSAHFTFHITLPVAAEFLLRLPPGIALPFPATDSLRIGVRITT
jgi:hypothetical protein